MPSALPFWDPGAFSNPASTNPNTGQPANADTSQPIRTAISDGPASLDPAISTWEIIYFGNVRAPGICRVEGGRRRLVDPRMIPGSSGQLPAVLAFMPAEFTVTLTMWDPAQFASFKALADLLYPKPQPSQVASQDPKTFALQAVDVNHPAFKSLSVSSVYIVDIRAPSPGPIPQTMVAVIDCVEFFPPTLEGVKTVQSSVSELSTGSFPQSPPQQPAVRAPPPDPSQTNINP
jgi:hypothetical protein